MKMMRKIMEISKSQEILMIIPQPRFSRLFFVLGFGLRSRRAGGGSATMENMGAVSTSGGAGSLLPSRGGSAGSASLISKAGKPRTYDRSTGETQAELLRLVKRLNRALGLPPGRATDGVATASAQMLSKMVSRYEVTRVSVQQTQRTIEQKSKDYDTFRGAYGDLKGDLAEFGAPASAGHLDRYLTVVARVLADPDLASTLSSSTGYPAGSGRASLVETKREQRTPSGKENALASPVRPSPVRSSSLRPSPARPSPALADASGFAHRSPYRHEVSRAGGQHVSAGEISGSVAPRSARKKLWDKAGVASGEVVVAVAKEEGEEDFSGHGSSYGDTSHLLRTAASAAGARAERQVQRLDLSRRSAGGDVSLPEWALSHPVIYSGRGVGSLLRDGGGAKGAPVGLESEVSAMEPELQELLVLDDLLYVFLGSEGRLVRPWYSKEAGKIEFAVDQTLDSSLRQLANKFLPLCLHLQVLQSFIETRFDYSCGLVNHAMAAAAKEIVWEFRLLVSQLETMLSEGKLSLHSMWYYCQPSLGTLQAVGGLLSEIINADLRGASSLNEAERRLKRNAGDPNKTKALAHLLERGSRPYLRMLEGWLGGSRVDDPYGEFLVRGREAEGEGGLTQGPGKDASQWRVWYSLRAEEEVPDFLRGRLAEKILATGKYLNVVRECGAERGGGGGSPSLSHIGPSGRELASTVDRCLASASQALLSFLHGPVDLLGRLRSLKRYFLLDQGDFLLHFIDAAEEELDKPHGQCSQRRLQSLFELAVKVSSSAAEPYNEDAYCVLAAEGGGLGGEDPARAALRSRRRQAGGSVLVGLLPEDGSGASSFTLGYKVNWPFSLVVTRQTLAKYQRVFAQLFAFKFVEKKLASSWQQQQQLRRQRLDATEPSLREALACKETLHYVNQYLGHMTFETIEPAWRVLEEEVRKAASLDDLVSAHEKFLDRVLLSSETFLAGETTRPHS